MRLALLVHDTQHVIRHNIVEQREIVGDGGRVEEQPVGRHQGSDGWKDRQQDEKRDAARDRQQAVGIHLAVRAPEDVAPAPPGNLQRMGGVTAAATFVRPAELEVMRFVGALRLAEGVLLARKPFPRRPSLTRRAAPG